VPDRRDVTGFSDAGRARVWDGPRTGEEARWTAASRRAAIAWSSVMRSVLLLALAAGTCWVYLDGRSVF
jgi:hypothetical protein